MKIDLGEWSDWIDAEKVFVQLNISYRTLQRWRLSGMIPYSRINGKYFYKKSDIIALLNNNYVIEKGGKDDRKL